jgi:cytochrome c oxidase subunit 2
MAMAVGAAACAAMALVARAATQRRIEILARKFEFVPAEIPVRAGEAITLVVTAADFVHGFTMPDFGVRRDLVPGKAVEMTITPRTAGRFHYLCDNFCGEGHDRMSGILVVAQAPDAR